MEIKGKGGRVERVYFHIDPTRRRLWGAQHQQESKERFLNTVDRENPKLKQTQFVDFCEVSLFPPLILSLSFSFFFLVSVSWSLSFSLFLSFFLCFCVVMPLTTRT